jgi:uncharacterized membrane protein
MNYILAAIFSNLSFAIGDNFSGLLMRKNKPLQVAFWSALVAAVLFAVPAVTIFGDEMRHMNPGNVALMLGLNVLVELGVLSFLAGWRAHFRQSRPCCR